MAVGRLALDKKPMRHFFSRVTIRKLNQPLAPGTVGSSKKLEKAGLCMSKKFVLEVTLENEECCEGCPVILMAGYTSNNNEKYKGCNLKIGRLFQTRKRPEGSPLKEVEE
jgi:hypothetical protein